MAIELKKLVYSDRTLEDTQEPSRGLVMVYLMSQGVVLWL